MLLCRESFNLPAHKLDSLKYLFAYRTSVGKIAFRKVTERIILKIYLLPHGQLIPKASVLVLWHPRIPTANT